MSISYMGFLFQSSARLPDHGSAMMPPWLVDTERRVPLGMWLSIFFCQIVVHTDSTPSGVITNAQLLAALLFCSLPSIPLQVYCVQQQAIATARSPHPPQQPMQRL